MGHALRHAQLPVEVVEEAGEAEFAIQTPPVELGDGKEKVGEAGSLASEKFGVAEGHLASCGVSGIVHGITVSCDFRALLEQPGKRFPAFSCSGSRPFSHLLGDRTADRGRLRDPGLRSKRSLKGNDLGPRSIELFRR
jgi:hypothetical protein